VNVQHISKVAGNQVYIGDNLLPIRRTYREGFIQEYLEGKGRDNRLVFGFLGGFG